MPFNSTGAKMTEKERAARQRAFEAGQQAWRESKNLERDNPYPHASPDHDMWRQGWEQEQELLD
jgi:hypothetical protein